MPGRSFGHRQPFDYLISFPLILYLLIICALVASVFFSISWKALKLAFSETAVLHAVWLSISTSIASTALSVVIGTPTGYVLSRYEFRGKTLVDTLLDIPIVLPPLVLGLSVLIFFNTVPTQNVKETEKICDTMSESQIPSSFQNW